MAQSLLLRRSSCALVAQRRPHACPCPRPASQSRARAVIVMAEAPAGAAAQTTAIPTPSATLQDNSPGLDRAHVVLARAQRDVAEFCSTTNKTPECWEASAYLAAKLQEADAESDPEHRKLHDLESLALNGLEVGASAFTRTLLMLKHSEARRKAAAAAAATSSTPSSSSIEQPGPAAAAAPKPPAAGALLDDEAAFMEHVAAVAKARVAEMNDADRRRRGVLARLFRAVDNDGDGLIDLEEAQLALEQLGAVLTDEDWCNISDAVDHKFRLDFDDFLQVATECAPPEAVAAANDAGNVAGATLHADGIDSKSFFRHSAAGHHPHHTAGR